MGMRIDLVQLGYDISLALRNLIHYAELDPAIAGHVEFCMHEIRLQTFDRPVQYANRFTPFNAWEKLLAELVAARPAVVGLSCYIWNIRTSIEFAEHLKILLPDTKVVLGGPEVTFRAVRIMDRHPRIDMIVRGEGEETFRQLLLRLVAGQDGTDVDGLSCRLPDGQVRHNPDRTPLPDLNVIPPPYRDELAAKAPALRQWDEFVVYETLRGCPFRCGYCLYGHKDPTVRFYAVERVVADILACLQSDLNVMVVDSQFGLKRERTHSILDALAAGKPYAGRLAMECHPDLIDEPLADRLAAAGTIQVGIGLQSISANTNRIMGRHFRPDRYAGALKLLRERDIPYYVDVIYGLPGDTWQDFLDSVDFVLSLPGTDVQFYRLLVLPGTQFYHEAQALGLAHADDPPYEVMYSATYTYKDLIRSHKLAFVYHLLHYAMGGAKATARLLTAARKRPSEFLLDLTAYLEQRGILATLHPDLIGDLGFVLHQVLADYLKARGLAHAAAIGQ